MRTLLAFLELRDYVIIAVIAVVANIIARTAVTPTEPDRLIRKRLRNVQPKLDAIMKHLGVELPPPSPSGLSPEVEELAMSSDTKIAAIRMYREENPGAGLAEAKEKIEAFYNKSRGR